MSLTVKVTNRNNTWKIVDKYAGQVFKFPPGDTVTIPTEAAVHIFGYGLPEGERRKKMMRMGIANLKDGQKMWDNITIRATGNVEPTGKEREVA
jgi:hypothetical protein